MSENYALIINDHYFIWIVGVKKKYRIYGPPRLNLTQPTQGGENGAIAHAIGTIRNIGTHTHTQYQSYKYVNLFLSDLQCVFLYAGTRQQVNKVRL